MLWSFATLEISNPQLFDVAAEECTFRNIVHFIPQDISNILQSFATLRFVNVPLFNVVARLCVQNGLRNFNSQDISNI
jgi:hypothetical protein